MANKTNEPVKLRGQLIKIKEVAELCAPFWSVDSLRNAAMKRNAPFPIKQIGSRWYAFREDVEEYMQGVYKQFGMDAPTKFKTSKHSIEPVSKIESFRNEREDKHEQDKQNQTSVKEPKNEMGNFANYINLCRYNMNEWEPTLINIPRDENGNIPELKFGLLNRQDYFRAPLGRRGELFYKDSENRFNSTCKKGCIPTLFAADICKPEERFPGTCFVTEELYLTIFAFVFCGFYKRDDNKIHAEYVFVRTDVGDNYALNQWKKNEYYYELRNL